MQEITVETPELELIPIERTSPITEKPKPDKKITGRQYRKALKRAWFIVGVERCRWGSSGFCRWGQYKRKSTCIGWGATGA